MESNCFTVWNLAETDFDSIFDEGIFSVYMLKSIAANEHLPSMMLEQLVYHPSKQVRLALAANSNLPSDLIKVLAQDDEIEVRMVLASSRQTSVEVLQMLSTDESAYVSVRALGTLGRIAQAHGAVQINSLRSQHKLLA
jgi:hypothetical protein